MLSTFSPRIHARPLLVVLSQWVDPVTKISAKVYLVGMKDLMIAFFQTAINVAGKTGTVLGQSVSSRRTMLARTSKAY